MNETREKLMEALECCRRGSCEHCPLQGEIGDELLVDTEALPTELLDRIEAALVE